MQRNWNKWMLIMIVFSLLVSLVRVSEIKAVNKQNFDKSAILNVGETKKVSITGIKAKEIEKTEWSVKNKKIVSLSDKKKTSVTLKGRKKGTTVLTAEVRTGQEKHQKTCTVKVVADTSVKAVVKHSRNVYYDTNKKLKSYYQNRVEGEYMDFYDTKSKVLRKAITYPTSTADGYIKKYTAEYYYDSDQKLVFAFAYRKVKGKVKEYRAYYGQDGRLYRYINANGKITDYKKGKKVSETTSSDLRYELYRYGTYYLHLALS